MTWEKRPRSKKGAKKTPYSPWRKLLLCTNCISFPWSTPSLFLSIFPTPMEHAVATLHLLLLSKCAPPLYPFLICANSSFPNEVFFVATSRLFLLSPWSMMLLCALCFSFPMEHAITMHHLFILFYGAHHFLQYHCFT